MRFGRVHAPAQNTPAACPPSHPPPAETAFRSCSVRLSAPTYSPPRQRRQALAGVVLLIAPGHALHPFTPRPRVSPLTWNMNTLMQPTTSLASTWPCTAIMKFARWRICAPDAVVTDRNGGTSGCESRVIDVAGCSRLVRRCTATELGI